MPFSFVPRRFGKSLFLDTLYNIFEAKKELFEGLAIYDKYDWQEKYPIIKISWGGDFKTLEQTKKTALDILEFNQKRLGVECKLDDEPEFGINEYKLKVPNKKINISLNYLFLDYLTNGIRVNKKLITSLLEANLEEFKRIFESLFASIPYNNYVKNTIGEYEGYYASVFYSYLAASGVKIVAEDVTNSGRIDLSILIKEKVYIVEFKVDELNALSQIKKKNYAKKYLNQAKEIYLIGISFDSKEKDIKEFEWERVV